jgi:hypothetical protein
VPTLTVETPPISTPPTEAGRAAAQNFAANRAALAQTQPRLLEALSASSHDVTWVYGREGYLTGMHPGERWHTGCSVPLLAARAMLRTLEAGTGAACLLHPSHAAQMRVALDRHGDHHALICITQDVWGLAVLLHCEDFSTEIRGGRLWFAWGDAWSSELGGLLDERPGLPTPSRFIRIPNTEPAVAERLVKGAQEIFAAHNARRAAMIAKCRAEGKPTVAPAGERTMCVIARSAFRLWDDAGHALFTTLSRGDASNVTWQRVDPDDPAGSSPLTLATTAAAADVVVAADVFRADAGPLTPAEQPWVTWVTTPRIPAAGSAGPNDRLLVADARWRDVAIAAGWAPEQIGEAGWPDATANVSASNATEPRLTLIADTVPLDPPESLADFSSHCLLWEKLRRYLLADPFALPEDVERWLRDQARAEGIDPSQLDKPLFLTRLVIPAYQQALAALLLDAGLPLSVHGAGWADLPRFAPHARGPVNSRDELREIAHVAAALVHPWPDTAAHAINVLGRPVIRASGRRKDTFVRDARLGLADASAGRGDQIPPLSVNAVLRT